MRIHVTGGYGFVGGHVVRELRSRGHDVSTSGSSDAFTSFSTAPDLVLHAGACVGRERCTADPGRAIEMNVTATLLLAQQCADSETRLLYVSSAEVGRASNLYALSKRWAEDACLLAMPSELLSIARLGMQYGPEARLGADTLTNFLRAAMEGEELRAYRDAWRTWTYVGDSARALALIAEASERWREHGKHSSKPAVYNVENASASHMLSDVAERVVALVGSGSVREVASPPGYSQIPALDTRSLRQLGWRPYIGLGEGMELAYEWLKEQALIAA